MKKWFQSITIGLVLLGGLAVAVPALAADTNGDCKDDTTLQAIPGCVPTAGNNPCGSDLANDPLALDCVGTANTGLSAADPRIIASRIVNVVLGVLGTIATMLVFYAGFLWMTAAGDDEQIGKAKSIMTAAIIGLVVILASYSISTFFVKSAYQAVNDTTYNTP